MRPNQKFKRGDVVHIAKDLGPCMTHFENDKDAIVLGSYRDQYGGDNTQDYTLMFCEDGNEVSWYEEHQLTFLRHGGEPEIEKVKLSRARRQSLESDPAWILANWLNIRGNPPGATMGVLMEWIGITNPWPHGEGWELAENQLRAYRLLDSALETGELSKLNERLKQLGFAEVKISE